MDEYGRMVEDLAGASLGVPAPERPVLNGRTPHYGVPEWRAAMGTPESIARRSRKGRSTYEVTAAGRRYMVGRDPFTESGDLVMVDHRTLVDMADAWMALHDSPDECSCDDLTAVLPTFRARVTWNVPERGCQGPSLVSHDIERTGERVVRIRRCHCARYQRLLGLDGGRRNSWQELTPGTSTNGRRPSRMSLRAPRRRASDPGAPITHDGRVVAYGTSHGRLTELCAPTGDASTIWHGHTLITRANARGKNVARATRREAARADWADESSVLVSALNATTEPTVEVTFPGVTVTIRRDAGTRWAVTIVRGDETVRIRTRTVGPIARAIVA